MAILLGILFSAYSISISNEFVIDVIIGNAPKNKVIQSNLMKIILTHLQLF